MKLSEFRHEMTNYRKDANREARQYKDSYIALNRLYSLYKRFDKRERSMANKVIAEWAVSEDENLRFDGLALIDNFRILIARPALKKLSRRLESSGNPGAPYELKKIDRIQERLDS